MSPSCVVSAEKLERLEKMSQQVRIGGKGTARRKKKIVHKTVGADDRKLQTALTKLRLTPITGIEEVNMYKTDNTVITFKNAKVDTSQQANIFAVHGQGEVKSLMDMLGPMVSKIGAQAEALGKKTDQTLPDLVGNFDMVA